MDFDVENKSTSSNSLYNISAVAGTNNGTITGVIVGGQIEVFNNTDQGVKSAVGYLAGIAGVNNGIAESNVVLALDLTSNSSSVKVAGLVGDNSSIAKVSDGRVIAVVMEFDSFTSTGKITGAGNVAGAVASNNGWVEWVGVESFLSWQKVEGGNSSIYYMLETSSTAKTIAGLICENSGTLKNSFINANINGLNNTIYTTSNATVETATYFIGKINGAETSNATYSIVVADDNSTYTPSPDTLPTADNSVWAKDERTGDEIQYNYLVIDETKVAFPYLIKDGEMFMINRPTGLVISINAEYKIRPGVVYVDSKVDNGQVDKPNIDQEIYDNLIAETVIVNYFDINSNNVEHNIYSISELISKKVVPEDENVQGGIRYEIVAGGNFARIEQDSEKGYSIVLLDVSRDEDNNPTPIIIRCYSIFNNDIDKYVAIFAEYGATELVLDSNAIIERDNEQTISTYVGGNSIIVNVDSINKKDTYKTVLDAKNKEEFLSLSFVATDIDGKTITVTQNDSNFDIGGILSINVNDWINSGFKISVKENAPITNRVQNINLTVNVNMDLNKYSSTYFGETIKTLLSKTLKISVAESATMLEIKTGGNAGSYQTNANIGFVVDIETSYVGSELIGSPIIINEDQISKYNKAIRFNESNKDSVRIHLSVVEDEFNVVKKLLETNKCDLAELFDVYAYFTRNNEGYEYHIELSLRDEFSVRYITNSFTLNVEFVADSNTRVSDSVEITFIPTKVSTFRVENYSAKTIDAYTQYTELITTRRQYPSKAHST